MPGQAGSSRSRSLVVLGAVLHVTCTFGVQVQQRVQAQTEEKLGSSLGLAEGSFKSMMRNAMEDAEGDSIDMDSAEYRESAAALSGVLGTEWNGQEIEKNAAQAENALLSGIANPRQVRRHDAKASAGLVLG